MTPPNYWYTKTGSDTKRWHKANFRKSRLEMLPGETEREATLRPGYDRIWDCGLVRWIWTKP